MKVFVYYPQTEEGIKALKERIADIHVDAVRQYLSELPNPTREKIEALRLAEQHLKEDNELEQKQAS